MHLNIFLCSVLIAASDTIEYGMKNALNGAKRLGEIFVKHGSNFNVIMDLPGG